MKPGETDANRKAVYFHLYDSDGLLASGNTSDGEGAVYAASAGEVKWKRNNAAAFTNIGTLANFTHVSNGLYRWIPDDAEVQASDGEATGVLEIKKLGTVRTEHVPVPIFYADVQEWNGTAVAAPTVAGIPKVEVSSIDANAITAASIAADAITAAKIADGAIDAATFAAGAIDAAAIATGAIDADALDATAVSEITAGLAVEADVEAAITAAVATLETDLNNLAIAFDDGTIGVRVSKIDLAVLESQLALLMPQVIVPGAGFIRAEFIDGADYTMTFVADGVGAGTLDDTPDDFVFHYQVGVTTVQNLRDAIDGSAYLIRGFWSTNVITGGSAPGSGGSGGDFLSDHVTPGTTPFVAICLDSDADAVLAVANAIKAKTDNLPVDPADASDIAAAFTIVDGKVDAVQASVDATAEVVNYIAAINLRYARVDQTVFSSPGKMLTSCRVRVFADEATKEAAVNGHADGVDGEIYRFHFNATDPGTGLADAFRFVENLAP